MFTIREVLKATKGELINGRVEQTVKGISCDSRTINAGELFVALEGDNFNGHNFVAEAIGKGAAGAVISCHSEALRSKAEESKREILPPPRRGQDDKKRQILRFAQNDTCIIEVVDTLKALGDIAHFHRMRFNIPVIAVTGSNGKTTTKDMLAHLLAVKYKALKNQGTFNNLIGVPLTIFKLNAQHQICILEMGANHLGEISRLADIARPNIGIITNIGPSHLEFFKDIETVAQAKTELFRNFTNTDMAVWNADDAMLSGLYQTLNCKKKTFGLSDGCDYQATHIEYLEGGPVPRPVPRSFSVGGSQTQILNRSCVGGWRFVLNASKLIKLRLLGRYSIHNALAAIAVGDTLGVEYEDIFKSLLNFNTPSMRMQILEAGGVTIINDSYNSNPKSMEFAINVLSGFNAKGRRVLVSADMLELGAVSRYFHHQMGLHAASAGIDIFIGVGEMSKEAIDAAVKAGMNEDFVFSCKDTREAADVLLKILHAGDVVLIKGSRAMRMENVCSTIYSTH